MKRHFTREERRHRSQRRLQLITYLLFLLLLLAWLLSYTVMTVEAEPGAAEAQETAVPAVYLGEPQDGRLPGDDTPATTRCYLTEEEAEEAENELIMQALIAKANRIDNCTVTWYTDSTCGKTPDNPSYGITASGLPTVAELTCAVDNNVIPRYADVFVQFADGTIKQYWATDTGVKGNHVDIYEPDYDTCIHNGRQILTVWWIKEVENE